METARNPRISSIEMNGERPDFALKSHGAPADA